MLCVGGNVEIQNFYEFRQENRKVQYFGEEFCIIQIFKYIRILGFSNDVIGYGLLRKFYIVLYRDIYKVVDDIVIGGDDRGEFIEEVMKFKLRGVLVMCSYGYMFLVRFTKVRYFN